MGEVINSEIKGKAKANMNVGNSLYLDAEFLNGGEEKYIESPINVDKNDVIILWDGSQAGTVYPGIKGALGSTLKVFKTNNNGSFLYLYLLSKQELIYRSYTTPNIPHVIKNFTSVFEIWQPNSFEQKQIVNLLIKLLENITLHQRNLFFPVKIFNISHIL